MADMLLKGTSSGQRHFSDVYVKLAEKNEFATHSVQSSHSVILYSKTIHIRRKAADTTVHVVFFADKRLTNKHICSNGPFKYS